MEKSPRLYALQTTSFSELIASDPKLWLHYDPVHPVYIKSPTPSDRQLPAQLVQQISEDRAAVEGRWDAMIAAAARSQVQGLDERPEAPQPSSNWPETEFFTETDR